MHEKIQEAYFLANLKKNGQISPLFLSLGFLLNKAGQIVKEKGDNLLQGYNITTKHFGILVFLKDNPTNSQREIGRSLLIDRTTMIKLLDDLEKAGYINRERNKSDRRIYNILLTKNGREIIPILDKQIRDLEKEFLAKINLEHQKILVDSLTKLIT